MVLQFCVTKVFLTEFTPDKIPSATAEVDVVFYEGAAFSRKSHYNITVRTLLPIHAMYLMQVGEEILH